MHESLNLVLFFIMFERLLLIIINLIFSLSLITASLFCESSTDERIVCPILNYLFSQFEVPSNMNVDDYFLRQMGFVSIFNFYFTRSQSGFFFINSYNSYNRILILFASDNKCWSELVFKGTIPPTFIRLHCLSVHCKTLKI